MDITDPRYPMVPGLQEVRGYIFTIQALEELYSSKKKLESLDSIPLTLQTSLRREQEELLKKLFLPSVETKEDIPMKEYIVSRLTETCNKCGYSVVTNRLVDSENYHESSAVWECPQCNSDTGCSEQWDYFHVRS